MKIFPGFVVFCQLIRIVSKKWCKILKDTYKANVKKKEISLGLLFHREKNMHGCEEMIYSGSSTTHGQPSLTPPQLQSAMTQLEGMLGRLEHSIKDIVRNLEQKKQVGHNLLVNL